MHMNDIFLCTAAWHIAVAADGAALATLVAGCSNGVTPGPRRTPGAEARGDLMEDLTGRGGWKWIYQ